jgi:hypothetical protein
MYLDTRFCDRSQIVLEERHQWSWEPFLKPEEVTEEDSGGTTIDLTLGEMAIAFAVADQVTWQSTAKTASPIRETEDPGEQDVWKLNQEDGKLISQEDVDCQTVPAQFGLDVQPSEVCTT